MSPIIKGDTEFPYMVLGTSLHCHVQHLQNSSTLFENMIAYLV